MNYYGMYGVDGFVKGHCLPFQGHVYSCRGDIYDLEGIRKFRCLLNKSAKQINDAN